MKVLVFPSEAQVRLLDDLPPGIVREVFPVEELNISLELDWEGRVVGIVYHTLEAFHPDLRTLVSKRRGKR